ncbi:MAG: hypothetical protein Q9172_006355 [Xanthocarpia lactea]
MLYRKLTREVRTSFENADKIHAGPQLTSCRCLRAFIDETIRMNFPVNGDLNREALAGGITIEGQHLPEGTNIGVSVYALHYNEATFPELFMFQPDSWIVDEQTGTAPAGVAASESGFTPFSVEPRGCPGKNLAYIEMSITMAKVLYLCDVVTVEGSDLGSVNSQDASSQEGDSIEVGFFGFPTPIIPHANQTDSMKLGDELAFDPNPQDLSDSYNGEIREDYQGYGLPPLGHDGSPKIEDHHKKTVSFAVELDGSDSSDTEQPDVPFSEQVEHAFALHALYQSDGGILRNKFAARGASEDAQKSKTNIQGQISSKTLIIGHKAGLWLKNYDFDSFCQAGNTLILHQWNDLGFPFRPGPNKDLDKLKIVVNIKDGDKRAKQVTIKAFTEAGRRDYEKQVLPILQSNEPKPQIRVQDGNLKCGFECKRGPKDKEPSCDNGRDLEVHAPEIGYLRVLADWHRWREQPKLTENSRVFEAAVFCLLYPASIDKNEYEIKVPDGTTFRVSRDARPSLTAEVQEALSHITAAESQEGVEPEKITLSPFIPIQPIILGRPPASPSQKSPGLARAEGTIFVHRPANFTHFRYDPPHTMEKFYKLARRELYPETPGRLRLRINPSDAFRQEGKLLLPMREHKSYLNPDENGETLEDIWKDSIVDKWLNPQEDVWVIKVFPLKDSAQVYDGMRDEAKGQKPERWDLSALVTASSDVSEDNSEDGGWNKPPESLMDGLAKISLNLLKIDPRKSSMGIVLRVKREIPSEWLRWNSSMTFIQFLLEVLYKIDSQAIAIYPGDYEEPLDDGKGLELEQSLALEAMQEMKRKSTISREAAEVLARPPVIRTPAEADGWFNDPRPQPPDMTRNPGGTHLGPAPSYAVNALIYSATDMAWLQERLLRAENEILMREEACRVQKVPTKQRRESATQTKADELDPENRYKPKSDDSMIERPTGNARLWCYRCRCDVHDLTEKERENHAKKCGITVDDFALVEFRKGFMPLHVLKSNSKPTAVEPGGRRKKTTAVEAAPTATDSAEKTTSTGTRGGRKRKTAALENPTEVLPAGPPKKTAADNDTPDNEESAKTRSTRAKSVPVDTSEAPTPAQLRTGQRGGTTARNKRQQEAEETPSSNLRSGPGSSRRTRSDTNANDLPKGSWVPPPTHQAEEPPATQSQNAAKVDDKSPSAKRERKSRNAKAIKEADVAEGETDRPTTRRPGRRKKAQTDTDGARATTDEAPTQRNTAEPPAPASGEALGPQSGKSRAKPGSKAKAAAIKDADNPDDPEDPPKPTRKTRRKKAKAEDETSPRDLSASKSGTQQQDPLGRTRASRAKKQDTKPEETGPPRAQTKPAKTTKTASKKEGSRTAADIPSSSSHPHPNAEGNSVGEESSKPAEEAPKTRRGRSNAITTTATAAAAAATSSRKRKAPATKPTPEDSLGKRRKLAPIEEEAEAQPAKTVGAAENAASELAAGVDENNTEVSPVKGKGKEKEKAAATEPTTTKESSNKRKTAASNDIATTAPPPKRRKPSPMEETETQAETEIQPTVSTGAAGNTTSDLTDVDKMGKGKAAVGNPAPEPPTGVAENPTTDDSPVKGKGKAAAKAPSTTSLQKRKTPPAQASTAQSPSAKKRKRDAETTSQQPPAAGSATEQTIPPMEATGTEAVGDVVYTGANTGIDIRESQANTSEAQAQAEVQAESSARPKRTRTPTPKAAEEEKEKKGRREKK